MLCNLVLVYKTWPSIRRILIKLDQLLTPPLQCTSFASSRQPWATPLVAASLILTMNSLWTSISFPSFHLISLFLLSPFYHFPFWVIYFYPSLVPLSQPLMNTLYLIPCVYMYLLLYVPPVSLLVFLPEIIPINTLSRHHCSDWGYVVLIPIYGH